MNRQDTNSAKDPLGALGVLASWRFVFAKQFDGHSVCTSMAIQGFRQPAADYRGAEMSTGRTQEVETVKLAQEVRPFTVRSFGLTDKGQVRTSNEDQFLITELAQAMRTQSSSMPRPKMQFS